MKRRLNVFGIRLILGAMMSFQPFVYASPFGRITGTVFDSQTNEPLPSANVFISGTNYGAATDLRGQFVITQVPAGRHNLVARYIGYQEKTMAVQVRAGETLDKAIGLDFQSVEGEVVVVTAQAEGQIRAISEQLASNTIANIVSEARIKELPDVNAAESIGRLPGVSIQRSGGEANKVAIRGLSPKYNTVTVNGVRVPATGGDDRSVDLSLISSSMLAGISVKKANTPDMDADAIGGTVDLRLKEAADRLQIHVSAQGGYNRLQNCYGNHNFTGSVSNRFMNSRLGMIASINSDKYDRSADKFWGDYRQTTEAGTGLTQIIASNISLREENVTRGRTGASLLLDYRIPYGKITANSFYNRLSWDGLFRIDRMHVFDNRHYYELEKRGGTTSIFTGTFGMEQNFDWIRYDLSAARTSSRTNNPGERAWSFVQENNAFLTARIDPYTHPNEIPAFATVDSNNTGLSSMYILDTKRHENETSFQLNAEIPFRFGNRMDGRIKLGGKFRWLDRMNDEERDGRHGIQYGGSTGVNTILTAVLQNLAEEHPDRWNWQSDSALTRQNGIFPITRVLSDYRRSDFLDGEYPLGFVVDQTLMDQMMDALFESGENRRYAIDSRGRDYDGIERYQAGYIMTELNLGKHLTLLPGIRWEGDFSRYSGQRYRELVVNNIQEEPKEFDDITTERNNSFWLPMMHLMVSPTDWMKIRLARTETLTRPDYIHYAPITWINSQQNYMRAANSALKPAHSKNYDISVSVYQNHVGLFSISGFHKTIDDLIFQTSYKLMAGVPVLPGLNIPDSWLVGAAPQMDTYINNTKPAIYQGFEIDWQTYFWYLPPIFRGVVLNMNYTRIYSEIEKILYYNNQGDIIPGTRPPRRENVLIDSSRVARMPDQPAHIFNVTLGYDFKGFSARLSYLYQTNRVTFISTEPALDNFSGTYARWDLTFQQRLGPRIQLFSNFTNLNNRPDQNFRGAALTNPTYTEYYGFAMDAGIRYRF
ncbi:MAG TPA: TonB-dependent receptor [bacterium]|nr:TonB-dependent receptor [bacterium]